MAPVLAVICLAAAPAAHAGDGLVSRSGDGVTITVTFTDAVDSLFIRTTGVFPNGSIVLDENAVAGAGTKLVPAGGSGCSVIDDANDDDVTCPRMSAQRLVVEFAGAGDFLEVQELSNVDITLDVRGGAGDDPQLWGSERDDVIDGGPGDDEIDGFRGDDELRGGSGDDQLEGWEDADEYWGGDGIDAVSMTNRDFDEGVTVTLDDIANDGVQQGAEHDNVHSDVEDVGGTAFADTLTGSAAANLLVGSGGIDRLEGLGGNDRYDAGAGNDVVLARDGLGERIDCGDGTDELIADTIDTSAACEQESRSAALEPPGYVFTPTGPNPGATPPPTVAPPPPGIAARISASWRVRGSTTAARVLALGALPAGATVELRCTGRRCSFTTKRRTVRRATPRLNLLSLVRRMRLRPGDTLEVFVRAPGVTGKAWLYQARRGRNPSRVTT